MEITVNLFGICTNFEPQYVGLEESGMHRTVLVNASDPSTFPPFIRDQHVGAHEATLKIAIRDLVHPEEAPSPPWFPHTTDPLGFLIWKLPGVLLTVEGAQPSEPGFSNLCIPRLKTYSGDGEIPGPGEAALLELPAKTACHFQYPPSHVGGFKMEKGAAVSSINIVVPSAEVYLHVQSFVTDDSVRIGVKAGAQIALSNVPADSTQDKDADFLLHFLTLASPPAFPTFPPSDLVSCTTLLNTYNPPPVIGDILTVPGCSNSNYP